MNREMEAIIGARSRQLEDAIAEQQPETRALLLVQFSEFIAGTFFDDSDSSTAPALHRAISYARRSLQEDPRPSMARARCLDKLSGYLESLWKLEGHWEHFTEALALANEAEASGSLFRNEDSDRYYSVICHNLSNLLVTLWQTAQGQVETLDRALDLLATSLNPAFGGPEPHLEPQSVSSALNTRAMLLEDKYALNDDPNDLEHAWNAIQEAIRLYPGRCGYYDRAAHIRAKMYDRSGQDNGSLLEEAVSLQMQAHRLADEGYNSQETTGEELDKTESNLSRLIGRRYERWGRLHDIETAVQFGRSVVARTPPHFPQYAKRCAGLGNALRDQAMRTGSLEPLDESIAIGEQVLISPSFHHIRADHSMHYNLLSGRYASHFDRTGSMRSLEKAIHFGNEALKAAVTTDERVWCKINLCKMMNSRANRQGPTDHLSFAQDLVRSAMSEANSEQWCAAAEVLADTLELSCDIDNLPQLRRETAGLERDAYDKTPGDHPKKSIRKLVLVNELTTSHLNTTTVVDTGVLADLYTDVQILLKNDNSDYSRTQYILSTLTDIKLAEYQVTGDSLSLDSALEHSKEFVEACTPDDPSKCRALQRMGTCFYMRGLHSKRESNFDEAASAFFAASQQSQSSFLGRFEALCNGGLGFAAIRAWGRAKFLLDAAIDLLPHLILRELSRRDQQRILRKYLRGMSNIAATVSLKVHDQDFAAALVQMEAGRGIMSRLATQLRTPLDRLALIDPQREKTYSDLRFRLWMSGKQTPAIPASDSFHVRQEINGQLSQLEEDIRRNVPGFARFLLPIPAGNFSSLVKGPNQAIVAFNTNPLMSSAFIVTESSIRSISLEGLDYGHLTWIENRLHGKDRITNGLFESRRERNSLLRDDLKWLWNEAVKPVLAELGFLQGSSTTAPNRVTWVTSSIMGLMPLHAAGHSWGSTMENTEANVISSYTPTFDNLRTSQLKTATNWNMPLEHLLVVSMPKTADWADLDVKEVVENVSTTMRQTGCRKITQLETPTRKEVIQALQDCSMVHFACHGQTDTRDPSSSGVLLRPGPDGIAEKLTVQDIAALDLPNAQVAFLEACSTAENPSKDLMDEVIHLASALQMVGFPHVIGTIWEAELGPANSLAEAFYEELALQREPTSDKVTTGLNAPDFALALHCAVQKLRNKRPLPRIRAFTESITSWAPFIHVGCQMQGEEGSPGSE